MTPGTNSWSTTDLTVVPSARSGAAYTLIGSKFYLMGGSTGTTDANVYVTDLSVSPNVWSSLAALPLASNSAVAVNLNGLIYYMGGRNNAGTTYYANVYVYNPATDGWSAGVSMPAALIYPSAVVIEGQDLRRRRHLPTARATPPRPTVFDPCKNNWSTVADMPGGVWGAYGASDGKFYVAAGAIGGSIYNPLPGVHVRPGDGHLVPDRAPTTSSTAAPAPAGSTASAAATAARRRPPPRSTRGYRTAPPAMPPG